MQEVLPRAAQPMTKVSIKNVWRSAVENPAEHRAQKMQSKLLRPLANGYFLPTPGLTTPQLALLLKGGCTTGTHLLQTLRTPFARLFSRERIGHINSQRTPHRTSMPLGFQCTTSFLHGTNLELSQGQPAQHVVAFEPLACLNVWTGL